MKIVFTGGHHTSALPIIEYIRQNYSKVSIHWFGHKTSMLGNKNVSLEYREIISKNIPFYNLKAGKLYKTFNIFRLLKVPWGVIQSFYLLLKIKPDIIVSFGGYLAAPTVFSGWILGIPSITHEQTVVAGYANKFISVFAEKILISWRESADNFPKHKTIYTGLPLRESIFEVKSNSFEAGNKLPYIYITAGKTGSHKINMVIQQILEELLKEANVIHQTGEHSKYNDYEDLSSLYFEIKDKLPGKYFARKFIYENEIGEAFNKAELVVSRAGAHTVSELLALEKKCILIPIPWVSHNEQYKNAKLLEDGGLGVIIREKDLSPQNLKDLAVKLLFKNIEKNSVKKYVFNKNSTQSIVNEIFKTIQEK